MPELPDITVYQEALARRIDGTELRGIRFKSPFVLRTVEPGVDQLVGRKVVGVRRLAKQLVLALDGDFFIALHLMISGRLHWKPPAAPIKGRNDLAAFDFDAGTLTFTEASKKKRAAIHLLAGEAALAARDPGGIDALTIDFATFAETMAATPHTLKRCLTDQRVLAGIGNAYSDEILHRARLSPFKLPRTLSDEQMRALFDAMRTVLNEWVELLRTQTGDRFPAKVTAFRPEMAVHGRHKEPCPVCGKPVQRIRYADNEANYCAVCQTEGRLLADRSLSRLLKASWPKTLEELEAGI